MKIVEVQVTLKKLVADEGKLLTNGKMTAGSVYLAVGDSADNWQEVDADEQ